MGVLDGKSAIVTGSARGIGRATASALIAPAALSMKFRKPLLTLTDRNT